jgi:hypothetical protein
LSGRFDAATVEACGGVFYTILLQCTVIVRFASGSCHNLLMRRHFHVNSSKTLTPVLRTGDVPTSVTEIVQARG